MIQKVRKSAEFLFIVVIAVQLISAIFAKNIYAGSISFWPTRIDLSPGENIQQVQVTNEADEPAFVQATVFDWIEGGQSDVPSPTQDIIAVPAVFDLEPGEVQTIRLSFRNPKAEDVERVYRLQIMEVPKTAGLLPNTTVIAFRVVLPVFFSPPGAAPLPVWEMRREPLSHPELVLHNRGSAHLNVRNVQLSVGVNSEPLFESEDGGLILAGEMKSWALDDALDDLKEPINLHAETTTGAIDAVIKLSDK